MRVSASVRWGGIIRDSIAGMWERFSLTEKEGQKIKISGEVEATEFLLAGHFLTRRPINMEAVMRTFLPVWKLDKAFRVRDMRVNKVVFIFTDEVDLELVLANGSWSYDKYWLVLQRVEEDVSFPP